MNFMVFKTFLQQDVDFQKWLKRTGAILLVLTIFCTFSSVYRAEQLAKLDKAKDTAKEMQAVIDENKILDEEYNKATADGSGLIAKNDLNLFQENVLQRLQNMQLSILELKYIQEDKKDEQKQGQEEDINEYKYEIVFTGSYGNALNFMDSLLDADFQGKPRMLNIEKIKFEATQNNKVNVNVVYKIFTE